MSERVTDYMEGALPLAARLRTWLHLSLCGACRAYFDQIAKTARLVSDLPPGEPGPAAEERMLRALGVSNKGPPRL